MVVATTVIVPPALANDPAADLDPHAQIRASLDYLMFAYGVDEDEALRRLDLQDHTLEMVDAVRSTIGDELLDVWLDQAGGGRLTFLTSQPDQAATVLGPRLDDQVRLVRSTHTAAALRAAEAEVRARLGDAPDVYVGVDLRNETVEVAYRGGDAVRATQVRDLAGRRVPGPRAGVDIPVKVDVSAPEVDGVAKACDILACDTPMRAGVRLHIRRDNGTFGSCTSGFNIRDNYGVRYVLTAGHCVINAGPKRQFVYHNGLPVAWEKNASGSATDPNSPADTLYYKADEPRWDYAVLPYQVDGTNWGSYWINHPNAQRNRVAVKCVTPSAKACPTGGTAQIISGMYYWSQITVGWVACATGTGTAAIYPEKNTGYTPGTRCGEVKSKNIRQGSWTQTHSSGRGIRVNICARFGDSGGPLFGQTSGHAYGILSGGDDFSGACRTGADSEHNVYSPMSEILADVSSRTGRTFSIITSPSG